MDYTPEVLRNKGVPVKLAKIRKAEDDWTPIYSSDGELETEELHVRFTHNIIADIEETWDGLADWQEAMESKPVSTLRRTLSLIFMEPVDKIGGMLIEGRLPEYSNAIGTAWALANGVDPTVASRMLEAAEIQVDSQIETLNQELLTALGDAEEKKEKPSTPGKKRSPSGAKQTKDTKTSGKQAPPKS